MEINFSQLGIFDFIVLTIIGLSTLFAFFKGFIRTVLSFIGWLVSILTVAYAYNAVYALLKTVMSQSEVVLQLTASGGLFIVTFLTMYIINLQISGLFKKAVGGITDRTLGLAFGIIRGVFIASLGFLAVIIAHTWVTGMPKEADKKVGPEWLITAQSYNVLNVSTEIIMRMLPADFEQNLKLSVATLTTDIPKMGIGTVDSPEIPSILTGEEQKLMKMVLKAIPPEQLGQLYMKYGGNTQGLSDLERKAIYREIIQLYRDAKTQGQVKFVDLVGEQKLQQLEQSLAATNEISDKSDETGYRQQQLKQMDHLLNTVE